MKTIPLTQGREAIVSECDYKYLIQWNWCFLKCRDKSGYAMRGSGPRRAREYVFMHKVIAERMGIIGRIDHKNQNKLDNRRRNLRHGTRSQNGANRGLDQSNTSGYKGVYWHKRSEKWMAYIMVENRRIYLKLWSDLKEAAKAYNRAALKYFGPYACLNSI